MLLKSITEASYHNQKGAHAVKVMWVSEDHDIPTNTLGPFNSEEAAREFEDMIIDMDPDSEYIYSTETIQFSFDDPEVFIDDLKDMMK